MLDPFAGTGTTLLAAYKLGRMGLGFEVYERYLEIFEKRLQSEEASSAEEAATPPLLHHDSAHNMRRYLESNSVDFILTSPPYWDILRAKRSADGRRKRDYGDDEADLGRLDSYELFLEELTAIFRQAHALLKPGRICAVVVMDIRKKNRFYPLHMDLCASLQPAGFCLEDIIIWDRRHEYSYLRPLGYPAVFSVNKVHEYLLLFSAQKKSKG